MDPEKRNSEPDRDAFLDSDSNASTISVASAASSAANKTPMKITNTPGRTPSRSRTPRSAGKRTPGSRPRTPSYGDRFIPNRASMQFDLSHYMVMKEAESKSKEREGEDSEHKRTPQQEEFERIMSENLNGGDISSAKIMNFKPRAPSAPEGFRNQMRVLYSTTKSSAKKKTLRYIPQVPERILDGPDMVDDYYLNLLDWSVNNLLAVCLGSHVYLWNASNGDITELLSLESGPDYVTSVSWFPEGHLLAVGTTTGEVQLWDAQQKKRLRTMLGHPARVPALAWNSYILSSGCRSGKIHHHDVRQAEHHVGTLNGHSQEVCGLRWSPDARYLASGGNDNLLNVWPGMATQPVHTFSQHQAAVKAVAWCPWQPSILASGGGSNDRHIRLWNCSSGAPLQSVDTESQVCSILWSKDHRELISGHGFTKFQLSIWKYPSLTKVTDLLGHSARVLHMALSPDGSTVVSAGADETLRLWKCFAVDKDKKPKKAMTSSSALLRQSIR